MKYVKLEYSDEQYTIIERKAADECMPVNSYCMRAVKFCVEGRLNGNIDILQTPQPKTIKKSRAEEKHHAYALLMAMTPWKVIINAPEYATLAEGRKVSLYKEWRNTPHGRLALINEDITHLVASIKESQGWNNEAGRANVASFTEQLAVLVAQRDSIAAGNLPAPIQDINTLTIYAEVLAHPDYDALTYEEQEALAEKLGAKF